VKIWILASLIIVMNLAGFIIMGMDKKRAKNNNYRISERTLWTIALLGGAVGATTGMNHYRHKTKHAQFKYGLPVLAVLEIGIFIYLFMLLA
jgi:uncharacterized membrane protein YsdA (DUF1294 family)